MTQTYRRKRNRDTWHFCANCRHWPSVKPNARTETVSGAEHNTTAVISRKVTDYISTNPSELLCLMSFDCKTVTGIDATLRDCGGLISRNRQIADRSCELIKGKDKSLSRVREIRFRIWRQPFSGF